VSFSNTVTTRQGNTVVLTQVIDEDVESGDVWTGSDVSTIGDDCSVRVRSAGGPHR
jgi:hypothetical protein